jgi:hypothetical protein
MNGKRCHLLPDTKINNEKNTSFKNNGGNNNNYSSCFSYYNDCSRTPLGSTEIQQVYTNSSLTI